LSVDNTVGEINRFGDKIFADSGKNASLRLFKRGLNFDFAAQRNFATDMAINDWVMHLDCDEIMSHHLSEQLQTIVGQCEDNHLSIVLLPRCNLVDNRLAEWPDYQARLFKKKYRYFGKIHETIDGCYTDDCCRCELELIHWCSSKDRLKHHNFYQDERFK
jgi:hypothetical protein